MLSSFVLWDNNEPLFDQFVTWDKKVDFIQQPATTSSVVELRRSSKVLPKSKLAAKRGHDHCLVVCCPSDPLQLSEFQQNHYIWEACSANRWDTLKTAKPAASISQQNGPNFSPRHCLTTGSTTNPSKVEWIGYEILPHLPYSPDHLPTDYHFFKHLDNFFFVFFLSDKDCSFY